MLDKSLKENSACWDLLAFPSSGGGPQASRMLPAAPSLEPALKKLEHTAMLQEIECDL